VNIHIGNAFDVVAEHKQTTTSALIPTPGKWNLKSPCATTRIRPSRPGERAHRGDWEMVSSTYKYTKTAPRRQFIVPVAKDGTSVLKYRIRARW